MKAGGLLALGLVTIAGVGMDGMGIELLLELRRPWIWLGTGSAEGTWALGAAMEAGIAGGICAGTRTSTETGAADIIVFFVSAVVVFCTGGDTSSTLDAESSITITLCVWTVLLVSEAWLWSEGNWAVGWALDELDDGCEVHVRNNYLHGLEHSQSISETNVQVTRSGFQPKPVRTTQLFMTIVKPKPNASNFLITFNAQSIENHSLCDVENGDSKIMENYN